jgi:hypothetical protein
MRELAHFQGLHCEVGEQVEQRVEMLAFDQFRHLVVGFDPADDAAKVVKVVLCQGEYFSYLNLTCKVKMYQSNS